MSNMIIDENGEKRTTQWSAPPKALVLCPVEGCSHTGELITKHHCRNEHGMERHEVEEKYGMPYLIEVSYTIPYEQTIKQWNSTSKGYFI